MSAPSRDAPAERLARAFERPTLVAYLVGGHPSPEAFLAHASAVVRGGAGVLEIGIPFSDPIADGPTIQAAATAALAAGVTPKDVLGLAGRVHEAHPDVPLVLMTYANLPSRMGLEAFRDAALAAGVCGVILPDVPLEEAPPFQEALAPLALVLLASPASDADRLARLAAATRGFLYAVGRFGVTGARSGLAEETLATTRRVAAAARAADVPLAVGFGVARPEDASALVAAGADGVVVGSAFVQRVLDGVPPSGSEALARELAGAVRAAGARRNG